MLYFKNQLLYMYMYSAINEFMETYDFELYIILITISIELHLLFLLIIVLYACRQDSQFGLLQCLIVNMTTLFI